MSLSLKVVTGAAALVLASSSAYAICSPNPAGVLGGAAAGAAAGAVVGGPVGAAIGGAAGGTIGAAALPPTACTYVIETEVPETTVEATVVIGEPLPEAITLHPIPEHEAYVFAYVNGERVLVDPHTRVVVEVVKKDS